MSIKYRNKIPLLKEMKTTPSDWNIYADPQKNPDDLEWEIKTRILLNVIDELIHKIQIAACLPYIIKNKCLLKKYFTEEQVDAIITSCDHIEKRGLSKLAASNIDDHKIQRESGINPLASIMYTINQNAAFCKILSTYKNQHCPKVLYLMKKIRELRTILATKLSVTLAQEIKHNAHMRHCFALRKGRGDQIRLLVDRIAYQRDTLGLQVALKQEKIDVLKSQMEQLKETFQRNIRKFTLKSQQAMQMDSTESEQKQAQLSLEAETKSQRYVQLLRANMAAERKLRAIKSKKEAQLVSWLAKYDADMEERHDEYELIKNGYDEENAELYAVKQLMAALDVEYLPMVEDKLAEKQREWEDRVFLFLKGRSARRIQKWWRAYLARKAEKRRLAKEKWLAKQAKNKIKTPKF